MDSTTADEIAAGQKLFHAKNNLNMKIGILQ